MFIFLLQKSGWSDNSGSAVSQTLCLCTNVRTAALTTLYSRFRLGEFPILLHMSWNVMNPLGPLMSFTYNIFPIIQSVNMSAFPWYLMWLLFHNKVDTGIEGSWQFKCSHVFNTEFQKWEVIICNPLKARHFRFKKNTQVFVSKGSNNIFRNMIPLTERLRLEQPSNPLQQERCLHLF